MGKMYVANTDGSRLLDGTFTANCDHPTTRRGAVASIDRCMPISARNLHPLAFIEEKVFYKVFHSLTSTHLETNKNIRSPVQVEER